MENITIKIISDTKELPTFPQCNFFHSTELFTIFERSPAHTPFMVFAIGNDGRIIAHLLTVMRRRGSFFPPYLYTHAHIYGEGEYEEGCDRAALFNMMLLAITRKLRYRLCLYIEISDMSHKMFGYKQLRRAGYFPVQWMEIHQSLHSIPPEQRLSAKMRKLIRKGMKKGAVTHETEDECEIRAFYKIMRGYNLSKFRRFTPPYEWFVELAHSESGRVFITTYKGKVIGGCACVYSGGDAYVWYAASLRKSYPRVRPDVLTIWHAISYAHQCGYAHIRFMDVGLPFSRNPLREFILKFGGKPVSTYRWFRFSLSWVNRLLSWFSL